MLGRTYILPVMVAPPLFLPRTENNSWRPANFARGSIAITPKSDYTISSYHHMIPYPTANLKIGELGDPLYILSMPNIRRAEILSEQKEFETADGHVIGRVSDIAITAYGGERYPIPRQVFYGSYEVIGQVGLRLVSQRLIHVRRAWPILSAHAEYNYGDDRGTVSVGRGGWLYQSDDDDFGVINSEVKLQGHAEVGSITEIESALWEWRINTAVIILTFLPPVLSLLALLAMASSLVHSPEWITNTLLGLETVLLLAGVIAVAWMRNSGWRLKAAMNAGNSIARAFQVAVALLGYRTSTAFPHMSLWRAAQMTKNIGPDSKTARRCLVPDADTLLTKLKQTLGETLDTMKTRIKRNHASERQAEWCVVVAIIVVVVSNLFLILVKHMFTVELLAVWLPALIGSLHMLHQKKQTSERLVWFKECASQLKFIQEQILTLTSSPHTSVERQQGDLEAALQFLCRVIGQYAQREIRFELEQDPNIPI